MEYLSWDLSILSRAVAYPNLSGASTHVGLSQPQLSRIIAKLEDETGLTLLDRETRRKSSWTPAAYRLAEIYQRTYQSFRADVAALEGSAFPEHLRIGTLEGLLPLALPFVHALLESSEVMVCDLMVFDTSYLEEKFAKDELDLILSVREPGRKKFKNVKALGYQTEDRIGESNAASVPKVYSSFEYDSQPHKGKPKEKAFVSNSLAVRREWLSRYSGEGSMPSPVRSKKTGKQDELTVILLAHDHLSPAAWQTIAKLASAAREDD